MPSKTYLILRAPVGRVSKDAPPQCSQSFVFLCRNPKGLVRLRFDLVSPTRQGGLRPHLIEQGVVLPVSFKNPRLSRPHRPILAAPITTFGFIN
jgi:hypothetical protein